MKRASGCGKIGVGLFVAVGLLAVGAILLLKTLSYRQKQLFIKSMPPTVLVTDPDPGATAVTGSYLNVSATIMGTRPIARAELWLDGQLTETQNNERPEDNSPFYANFSVLIPSDGPHMIYVYAMDRDGIIGQSLPVNLMAQTVESFAAVPAKEGESLNDIANANGVSPETVQALNPGVGSQPSAGTQIKVPLKQQPDQPTKPNVPPAGNLPPVIPNNIPALPVSTPQIVRVLPFSSLLASAAPTNLRAGYDKCKIKLFWNDNALDEKSYRAVLTKVVDNRVALRYVDLAAHPGIGPVSAEIEPKPTGKGTFSIYVEAVNSSASQPSNPVWVYVPFASGCPHSTGEARSLMISLTDITTNSNYSSVYCYISFEDWPELWMPTVNGKPTFITLNGKSAQIPAPQGVYSMNILTYLKDKVLDLSGECNGWAGNVWSKLGIFKARFYPETWTGERLELQGSTYRIGIKLMAFEETDAPPMAPITDRTLPVPYNVRSEQPYGLSPKHTEQVLYWKWDGDWKQAKSFEIFLDGKVYSKMIPGPWQAGFSTYKTVVQVPRLCGLPLRWQVAVTALDGSTSMLSEPLEQKLPTCQMSLRVSFDTLELDRTDEGTSDGPDACETLDLYFKVSVKNFVDYHWGFYGGSDFNKGGLFYGVHCGIYEIANLTEAPIAPVVLTVPLVPNENIHAIKIAAQFLDRDLPCCDDPIFDWWSVLGTDAGVPELAIAGQKWDQCYVTKVTEFRSTGEATARLTYSYALYPNKCRETPPENPYLLK